MDDLTLMLSIISCVIVGIPILILILWKLITASKSRKKPQQKDTSDEIPTVEEKVYREPKPVEKERYFPLPVNADTYGEYQIYESLKDYEKQGCRFLFRLYIPVNREEVTEIDALMISPKGIFVFESKNFKGYVRGGENDRMWGQAKTDKEGNSKNIKFYNPIMQNEMHMKCLNRVLDFKYPLFSIVVFSEECVLTDDIDFSQGNTHVVSISELKEEVDTFYKYMMPERSDSEIDIEAVSRYLYRYTKVSDNVKAKHIQNIKDKYESESAVYK